MQINGIMDWVRGTVPAQPAPAKTGTPAKKPAKAKTKKPARRGRTVKARTIKARQAAGRSVAPVAAPAPAPAVTPEQTPAPQGKSWGDLAKEILPGVAATITAARAQRQIEKINAKRLEAGQPPLTTEEIAQYNEAIAPVVKVQGGVDSGTTNRLVWGGVAVVGGLLLIKAVMGSGNGQTARK